ncbi:MAG: GNAT family N-acetyltransferase, partial [Loktanella sp.]|nr:GNAT family N-acetyltransferase [Loktanella sp.]
MLGTRIERSHWAFPEAGEIEGRYCRLVPLNLNHVAALWPLVEATPESFTYLRYGPFDVSEELSTLIADLSSRQDQPFWAVLDATGTPQGWLSICDVSQNDGAFEIGSIWFAPALQGTRAAREAIFL